MIKEQKSKMFENVVGEVEKGETMEYKFSKYDNLGKLAIISEYDNLVVTTRKEDTTPYFIFGYELDSPKWELLCVAETEAELSWKLKKVCDELEKMGIKYETEYRM